MKVFISWSGDRSKAIASALREWIPGVIQSVKPWMSDVDVGAGKRWGREVSGELAETKFGIICLTRENLTAPWLLFEAGALAKSIDDETFVCPYLIGFEESSDVPGGPLTQFQAKLANEQGTREMMLTVNKAMKGAGISEKQLEAQFKKWWPDLKERLEALPAAPTEEQPRRSPEEMIMEILEVVRGLERRDTAEETLRQSLLGAWYQGPLLGSLRGSLWQPHTILAGEQQQTPGPQVDLFAEATNRPDRSGGEEPPPRMHRSRRLGPRKKGAT
jgi:hypothetical protein